MLNFLVMLLVLLDVFTTIEAIDYHRAKEGNGLLLRVIRWGGLVPVMILTHVFIMIAIGYAQSARVDIVVGVIFGIAFGNNVRYVEIFR